MKHTPEPWIIRELHHEENDPKGFEDFAFGITHPLGPATKHGPIIAQSHEYICLVYGGDHDSANADLIRFAPRLARVLGRLASCIAISADTTAVRFARHETEVQASYVEALDLLSELNRGGGQ
jgi:hypothetical protein